MKKIQTPYSARSAGHYSPGVVYNGLLYVSGQLSVDPETGKLPEGGAANHAAQALKNLDMVLREAGCSRTDVLQCRVYIPDVAYWDEVNAVYAAFFGDHKPARVVVPTRELHGGSLVEIEAIAACGASKDAE